MRDGLARSLMMAIAALAGAGFVAHAQEVSPWDEEPHGAARLIAGAIQNAGGNKLERAGIEIRLDPGWKTYWRYPGNSGVPPALDFTGSENVKSVNTLWPAPDVFDDGAGGHSIGYHGDVVLPLQIIPNDAAKPSSLHIKLDYAVCGKLCVPAEAHLALTLSGKAGAEEPALTAAEARVPRRATLGAHDKSLSIASVRREGSGKHGRVVVLVGRARRCAGPHFCRRPDARMGLAAAPTGRQHRDWTGWIATLHVRTRWPPARRHSRGRDAEDHGGLAHRRHRSRSPSRLI